MKKYIGVKLIEAEPMTNKDKEGYKVVYPDGYVSWSPKEVFEKAYSPCGSEGCVSIRFDLKTGNWEFLPIEGTSQDEIILK